MVSYRTSDDWAELIRLLDKGKTLLLSKDGSTWITAYRRGIHKPVSDWGYPLMETNTYLIGDEVYYGNGLKDYLKWAGYRFIEPTE